MKLSYQLSGISNRKMALCIGDLVRYVGQTNYKMKEGVENIKASKTLSTLFLSKMRQGKGLTGMTIDNLLTALEVASLADLCYVKVDGVNPCDLFDKKKDITMDVFMNDNYFLIKSYQQSMIPGFRVDKQPIDRIMIKEKEKWCSWFEKNLRDYHHPTKWIKTVKEE